MDRKRNVINTGGVYWNQKDEYVRRPLWNISRTLKGDGNHPAGVIIEYEYKDYDRNSRAREV